MLQFIKRFDGQLGTRLAWLQHAIAQEMYHREETSVTIRQSFSRIRGSRIYDTNHFLHFSGNCGLLDDIPREAMIVMGGYSQDRIFSKLFGSKSELIQKNTANLTMLIGENCRLPKVN